MAEIKKYLDTTALGTLVDQIKAEDAKVLAAAQKYTDDAGKLYDVAGAATTAETNAKAYTDELADGAVATNTADIAKLNGDASTEGSVAKAVADAKAIIDADIDGVEEKADKNAEDIAAINNADNGILAQAKGYTDGQVETVQGNIDDLAEYVGTIPDTATATNIVAYVQEKTAGIATDTALEELTGRVAQAETDIDNIEKDYLKAADKTELEGKITDAQTAADGAQEYAEGVAGDLATEVTNRTNADNALDERITELEGTIVGLSGAMHFEGVKEAVPSDVSGYEQGDVIIVGNKEYVLNGDKFVEFGDASVNAEAITQLTGRVDIIDGNVTQAQTDIGELQVGILTKVEQTALDEAVAALEEVDGGLDTRLQAVEAKFGDGEGNVESQIATAKQEAIDAAAADATTKAGAAETNAKAYADGLDEAMNARVEALEAIDHSHANQAELDLIATGDKAKWDEAAGKAHEHANADELDKIADGDVAKWNAAEGNAKTYADGLNTAMTTKVDGIDARVTQNATDIATKAAQSDLEAAVERIAKNETDIAANLSAINSFTPITSEEVNALFA